MHSLRNYSPVNTTNTSLMRSQHRFGQRLGVIRQQALIWANLEPDLNRCMASLGHNGLIRVWLIIIMSKSRIRVTHNERDDVSNRRRLDCLLNRMFRRRSKKTSKLRMWGEFTAQRVSNAENVSIDDVIMLISYSHATGTRNTYLRKSDKLRW